MAQNLTKSQLITTNEILSVFHNFPWPYCAICQRDVDGLKIRYEPGPMTHVIIAECHGETERTNITDHLLAQLSRGDLKSGVAFHRVGIEGPGDE